MNRTEQYYFLLFFAVLAYFGISKYIFDKVYETIKLVNDEQFHIPQGIAYCEGNFTYWNSKISTPPGLYLISAAALGIYFKCDTYSLRFINLIASCVNLILFGAILRNMNILEKKQSIYVIQALNLVLLPPFYFFSYVYYTDMLSVTFLLIFAKLCFTCEHRSFILLSGFLSMMMIHSNVAWIAMVFFYKLLVKLVHSSRVFGNTHITKFHLSEDCEIAQKLDQFKLKQYYNFADMIAAIKYHKSTRFVTFFKHLSHENWLVLKTFSTLLISFVTFIILNGSVDLGDKIADKVTLHLPHLLYFLIFYGVFGLPFVLNKLTSTHRLIFTNKFNVLFLTIAIAMNVLGDSVVHPHDNRHFAFYIWNSWYRKYNISVYATIPVYIFLLFSLYDNLKDQNCISFLLPYCLCLIFVLGLQKNFDVRNFLRPFIILRLRFVRPSMRLVMYEFLYYVGINTAAFYIFFTREVYCNNNVQRIFW